MKIWHRKIVFWNLKFLFIFLRKSYAKKYIFFSSLTWIQSPKIPSFYSLKLCCLAAGFADCLELVDTISSNYDYWKQRLEDEQESGQRLCFLRRAEKAQQQQQQQQQLAAAGGRQVVDRAPRSSSLKRVPGSIEEDSACDSPTSETPPADQSEAVSHAEGQSQSALWLKEWVRWTNQRPRLVPRANHNPPHDGKSED